jgi:hypothetical protein
MRVSIEPINLRDLTWICSNLRPHDQAEISCQIHPSISFSDFGQRLYSSLHPDFSWIAYIDGQPVCAFGFQPQNVATWHGWAFGTKRMKRVMPAVTRRCLAEQDHLLSIGVRRVEVRRLSRMDISIKWLLQLGCEHEHLLKDYGRDGETFELWAWSLSRGRPTDRSAYRHAPLQPEQLPAEVPQG